MEISQTNFYTLRALNNFFCYMFGSARLDCHDFWSLQIHVWSDSWGFLKRLQWKKTYKYVFFISAEFNKNTSYVCMKYFCWTRANVCMRKYFTHEFFFGIVNPSLSIGKAPQENFEFFFQNPEMNFWTYIFHIKTRFRWVSPHMFFIT